MASDHQFPQLYNIVIDATDVRRLAEFYRRLLGYDWHPLTEPPAADEDWLVIVEPGSGRRMAFQKSEDLPRSTWPDGTIPQQLHLDLRVPTADELHRQHERAVSLGATVLLEQVDDPNEELIRVYADPDGHPFCIFCKPDSLA